MIKPYYEESNITIYNGDCLEVMKNLPAKSIDLILTDPPYQARFQKGGGHFGDRAYFENIKNGVGSSLKFEIDEFMPQIKRLIKSPFNGYFWTSQRLLFNYINFARDNNFFYDLLVWVKTNPIPTKNNKYLPDLEYCLYIRETGAYFNNNEPFEYYKKAKITGVRKTKWGHPTEKPLEVIMPSICISTKQNDLILDPFLGSGTTARACKDLGRKCIGIEISKEYCDIAIKRLGQEVLDFSEANK